MMKLKMGKYKKWLGYVFYSIVLVAVFLYLRFPSGVLEDYLQTRAESAFPQYRVSIGEAEPSLPPGLKITQPAISPRGEPQVSLFKAESLSLRPDVGSLLQGKLKISLDSRLYGGSLQGWIHFAERKWDGPFTASLRLKNLSLSEYAYLSTFLHRGVSGSLAGTISYANGEKSLLEGTGKTDLKVLNGAVEFSEPLFSINSVRFDELLIRLDIKNRIIDLKQVEVKGSDVQGTLSGSIRLQKQFSKSVLDLRGEVEPMAGFIKDNQEAARAMDLLKGRLKRGKLQFVVRGTLETPRVKLI